MRRLSLGSLLLLTVMSAPGCGDGPFFHALTTTRMVEVVYTRSLDPALQITGPDLLSNRTFIATCTSQLGELHLTPTWVEAGLTLTPVSAGVFRALVEVPTNRELGIAVRDPAACIYHHTMQGELYILRGIEINGVALTRVIGTEATPRLAFQVTADGQVIP